MATTGGRPPTSSTRPRSSVTRNDAPRSDRAAVAPNTTTDVGWVASSSARSQGRQATTSAEDGVLWRRTFPFRRGSNLKCLTALVR